MADARRKKFSVVLVAAFDRVARSTKHFLQLIDELDSLGVVFLSRRENIDTRGPIGRLFLTLISSIAELESDLIRERVRAGMRRAKLEGRQIGRARLDIDREQVRSSLRDIANQCGQSGITFRGRRFAGSSKRRTETSLPQWLHLM
jgi:DNA invertase Pin-like site-specific DNA recombinase